MFLRSKSRDDASLLHMQKYARVTPNLMFYTTLLSFLNSSFYKKAYIYAKKQPDKTTEAKYAMEHIFCICQEPNTKFIKTN
jgi:hypothetical protein